MDLKKIQQIHSDFCNERGWEKFHNPKNLVMALSGEVGELTELFQWIEGDECTEIMEDPNKRKAVEEEVADIMIYLSRICHLLNIDLEQSCLEKFIKNGVKYPVHLAKDNNLKYTEFVNQDLEF